MADDDSDDDDGVRLDTGDLKALFKVARNRTLLFAYCPGGADEDVLLLDRRRQPERLAKEARRESAGTKVAYGSMTVDGKILTVTCIKELPSLSRRLAKYLREKHVPLQVQLAQTEQVK